MRELARALIRLFFVAVLAAAAAVCWGGATASASASAIVAAAPNAGSQQPAAAGQLDPSPSSSPVVSTPSPDPPADACTVTVGGEKKHGRSDGSSWCCLSKGTIHEQCWSCTTYSLSDGWNLMGPGGGD